MADAHKPRCSVLGTETGHAGQVHTSPLIDRDPDLVLRRRPYTSGEAVRKARRPLSWADYVEDADSTYLDVSMALSGQLRNMPTDAQDDGWF